MRLKREHLIFISLIILFVFFLGLFIGFYTESTKINYRESSNNFEFSGGIKKTSMIIPGINNRGTGIAAIIETNIREGSGFTLVNINDLTAGSKTQESARFAVIEAKKYLGINDLSEIDVIYNIKTNAEFIDGPSAGAAMTISLISLLENKKLRNDVSITGFIDEKGIIGPASGIEEKAKALKKEGIDFLLISDQIPIRGDYLRLKNCSDYQEKEYCKVDYVRKNEFFIDGLKIISVKNLEESLKYFYVENE